MDILKSQKSLSKEEVVAIIEHYRFKKLRFADKIDRYKPETDFNLYPVSVTINGVTTGDTVTEVTFFLNGIVTFQIYVENSISDLNEYGSFYYMQVPLNQIFSLQMQDKY